MDPTMDPLFHEYIGSLYEGARLAGYEGRERLYASILAEAAWAGDVDRLDDLAHCRCCCHEHTFSWCPARYWGGCRGQGSIDVEGWVQHYERYHGMTREQFFG